MIVLLGMAMNGNAQIHLAAGHVDRYENFNSQYVEARTVDVWLPDNYDPAARYNVVYMHDGQMLFDSTTTWNKQEWGVDEVMGQLQSTGKIPGCIVVGIWNVPLWRHADYFPQKPYEQLSAEGKQLISDWKDAGGNPYFANGAAKSDNYLKFIVTELKPFIDSTYAVNTDRAHTFIMGSSMGGLISMYAICEYPEIFGGAACLSTHWTGLYFTDGNPIPEQFLQYLKKHAPSPADHLLYFDHGTETLDAMYGTYQIKADAILKKAGYTSSDYFSKTFTGTSHTEKAWRDRLDIPLMFLMSGQ